MLIQQLSSMEWKATFTTKMLLYSIFLLTVLGKTTSQVELGSSYKFLQTVKLSDEGSNAFGYQIRSTAEIEQVHSDLYSVKVNILFLRCVVLYYISSMYYILLQCFSWMAWNFLEDQKMLQIIM